MKHYSVQVDRDRIDNMPAVQTSRKHRQEILSDPEKRKAAFRMKEEILDAIEKGMSRGFNPFKDVNFITSDHRLLELRRSYEYIHEITEYHSGKTEKTVLSDIKTTLFGTIINSTGLDGEGTERHHKIRKCIPNLPDVTTIHELQHFFN